MIWEQSFLKGQIHSHSGTYKIDAHIWKGFSKFKDWSRTVADGHFKETGGCQIKMKA